MANTSIKRGLLPYGAIERETAYVAGGTVYPGDAVKINSSGLVVACSAGDGGWLGVAAHYATSANPILVWDHPEQKFYGQMDTGLSVAQTTVGQLFDIVVNSANTTYKQSRTEIDHTTAATTATLPLRMLAISGDVSNAAGDLCKCVVQINNHLLKGGTGTAGV